MYVILYIHARNDRLSSIYYFKTVMSRQTKKSYINISDLINTFERENSQKKIEQTSTRKERDYDKENNNQGNQNDRESVYREHNGKENGKMHTRPSSQTSAYENKNVNEPFNMISKTIKIDKRTPLHLQEQRQIPQKRQNQPKVYDTFRKTSTVSQEQIQRVSPTNSKAANFQMLQNLIFSERMFIDPERWQSYLQQAQADDKFQRALSAFLYSYFIQNYQ